MNAMLCMGYTQYDVCCMNIQDNYTSDKDDNRLDQSVLKASQQFTFKFHKLYFI